VPAGLAATAQSWIVDMASAGGRGGVRWGREREDGVRLRVRVGEVAGGGGNVSRDAVECVGGGGVVFVRGCFEAGEEGEAEGGHVSVLLAAMGGNRGAANIAVETGCLLGIKAPMWNVDVSGETWTVGVDWAVLS
jgi:hypothetical protein